MLRPTLPRKIEPPESFSPTDSFGSNYQKLLIEQYKVYVVDTTNKVSDRRGSAHTLLLTVNTSLITVYGLVLAKDAPLAASHGPWTWLLPIVGLLVSFTWFLLIRSYRALNSAKFKVVSEIERRLPAQLFDLEWPVRPALWADGPPTLFTIFRAALHEDLWTDARATGDGLRRAARMRRKEPARHPSAHRSPRALIAVPTIGAGSDAR
jgi:hypothetical protein